MFHAEASVPLVRRLITGYLFFCLAGLLLCVASALVLGFRHLLEENVLFVVLGPLAVIAVGAFSLYQHVRLHAVIENELTQVCRSKDRDALAVRPLAGNGPAVTGWNRLMERLSESESMGVLEERLAKALDSKKERRFLEVLHALSDGVVVTSLDGRIQFSNRAFASLVGASKTEELEGGDILQKLGAAQAQNADQVLSSR